MPTFTAKPRSFTNRPGSSKLGWLACARFEVNIKHPVLKDGAFDVQQTAAVQAGKFVRRLGALNAQQLRLLEESFAQVLGLNLAQGNSGQTPP